MEESRSMPLASEKLQSLNTSKMRHITNVHKFH